MGSILILSGGTGTPKLLDGFLRILDQSQLSIIVNTAEDIWISGCLVCPDIDSVMYTLSGWIDQSRWWGIRGDSFITHEFLARLGHFELLALGDLDRAVCIYRSELIRSGMNLTQAIQALCKSMKITSKLLPMSNDPVQTQILTQHGWMHFQEFWVKHRGELEVRDIRFRGIDEARPTPEALQAISEAERVIIGPSNPVTSIGPIIRILGDELRSKFVIAISPIIGNAPVSGPAGKFLRALGYPVSNYGIYLWYRDLIDDLIDVLVIHSTDQELTQLRCHRTNILLNSVESRRNLAREVLELEE